MYVYVCFVVDDVIVVWLFTRFMKREKKKRERERKVQAKVKQN
jgi:membrane protein implicated in regulation of membrane protease activity